MTQHRTPAGVPAGGQFAATALPEPTLDLKAAGPQPQGMSQDEAREYAAAQISHHISPVIGWIRRDGADGKDTAPHLQTFRERINLAATDIAGRLQAPAVLDGFTAAEVEDHLAREQHERQCGCDLKDDVCGTESYGEHWRHRMGVPDVEGIFDSIREMAAARDQRP